MDLHIVLSVDDAHLVLTALKANTERVLASINAQCQQQINPPPEPGAPAEPPPPAT